MGNSFRRRCRRAKVWLSTHPWVLTAFSVGVAIGILFRLPLIAWTLPPDTATFAAAIIGGALTVGVAAWFSKSDERNRVTRATIAIRLVLMPSLEAAKELASFAATLSHDSFNEANAALTPDQDKTGRKLHGSLSLEFWQMRRRLKGLEPVFQQLGPGGVIAFLDATDSAADFVDHIGNLDATIERETALLRRDFTDVGEPALGLSRRLAAALALAWIPD